MMIFFEFVFSGFWVFFGFLVLFAVATNFTIQLVKYFLDFAKVCVRGQPLIKNYYFNKPDEMKETEDAPEVEENVEKDLDTEEADKKKE